ncbi:MAG: phosphatidate cytidylyltransferase [Methylotenera sp.]|uniref:phosphatidate cytidylyltransferase n=1 Tax=Methylotenera sp. TaxID=2051956 RepID=UPI002487B8F8|nr:phosphatidate cytidylyltransferase [Methylotenera sp.]MDI1309735.1 phosphatidate cytidylyltransferase [Methylotenera sp.]
MLTELANTLVTLDPTHKFYWLISAVATLLLVASIIGWALKRKTLAKNNPLEKSLKLINNLVSRVNAWWVMVAILVIAFLAGKLGTIILFGFISYFALREFMTLTPTRAGDHRTLSLAFFLLIPLHYYLIYSDWYGLFSVLIPVYAFLLMPSISVLAQDTEHFLERAAKIQWGVMIAIYCISHAPALLLLTITNFEGQNTLLLFYFLLIVQLSDVLQYVFGNLFGKTKVAPIVSPNKTLEGLIGGGLSTILVGTGLWWITPFTPIQSAGMATVIVTMGFLGGLVMSAIKRSLGAKDWGNMIEGHGGMLDRMDSVSFAAPVFFHLVRYYFTP